MDRFLFSDILFAFSVIGKMEFELADGTTYICEDVGDGYKISYIVSMNNVKRVFASATSSEIEPALAEVCKAIDEVEMIR